ncbi:MAG: YbgC/FadM family acyl-CoA thioesterase [Trichlorobacter sp.]|nr:YbgC/FadM family acyl-CoA thioesterase [Trichlorobacter sp.]
MLIRVYYEDTDAAGVVYHSNYLDYCERARTEFLRERGFSVAELAAAGAVFPVVRMEVDFKAAAKHDDLLCVETIVEKINGSSIVFRQQIYHEADHKLLVRLLVTLACVNDKLRARRIPVELRALLSEEVLDADQS